MNTNTYKTIQELLIKLEQQLTVGLETAPKGNLRISKCRTAIQYYHCHENCKSQNGTYIKKKERALAQALAQRDYEQELLSTAKHAFRQLQQNPLYFKSVYKELGSVYETQNELRKSLIVPVILPNDSYIENWMNATYQTKPFADFTNEIYTQRGERVRSKSEKIIADAMNQAGVPYRYEKPLLVGSMLVHPDFTILDTDTRTEFYWEHLGMMDSPDYLKNALHKIQQYEKAGIFQGERMIYTFESTQTPLDTRLVERMISHYFLNAD